jgi:hypothetical protein
MAWTYSNSELNTTTEAGRLNTVRLLIGDIIETDPLLQDEEIIFALDQAGQNVYGAASWACRVIASTFARAVDTQLDGALESKFSDRIKHYTLMSQQLMDLGKSVGGKGMGVFGGGISNAAIKVAELDTDRPEPAFKRGQFTREEAGYYIPEYY